MRLIDAHTHAFDTVAGLGPRGELRATGGGRARWANGEEIALIPPALGERSFPYEALAGLLAENSVEKAVLLQGSFYGFANDYAWQAHKAHPDLFLPACTVDPFCTDAAGILHRHLHDTGFRVVKFELSSGGGLMGYHEPFPIDGPRMLPLYDMVAAAGATLVLDIGSPGMPSFQPGAVAGLARRYPQVKILVCHLLAPTPAGVPAALEALSGLRLENLWFDLAAVPWNLAPERYPYPTAGPLLQGAKAAVGAEKLVFGTDTPSTLTRESYQNQVSYIREAGVFTEAELERVYFQNALDVYPF